MKPKFEPGQVVTHKSSGELAIIEAPLYRCLVHQIGYLCVVTAGQDCRLQFTGRYKLSLAFPVNPAVMRQSDVPKASG